MKKLFLIAFAFVCVTASALSTVSFSDTYVDRLVRFSEEGESFYDILSGGKFSARGKVVLVSSDSSLALGANTPVAVAIGEWVFEGVLGDDPKFDPAKSKSVKIPLSGGVLKLAISRGALTWSVTAKTGSSNTGDEFEVSPAAEALYAEESATIALADGEAVRCTITIGGNSASASIPLSGSVKYQLKTVGAGDLAEEFGLCTVSVKGSAELARD